MRALSTGGRELRAIIGFPHYRLNEEFNKCRIVNNPYSAEFRKDVLLFARDRVLRDHQLAQCLDIAIRKAWLDLDENPRVRGLIVDAITSDREYVRTLKRTSGLFMLDTTLLKR